VRAQAHILTVMIGPGGRMSHRVRSQGRPAQSAHYTHRKGVVVPSREFQQRFAFSAVFLREQSRGVCEISRSTLVASSFEAGAQFPALTRARMPSPLPESR
jgi:hypothetical protein